MGKLRERKEIKEVDKWAVETVYKNDEEFKKDFGKVKLELKKLKEYVDKFLDSKEDFKKLFLYMEELDLMISRLCLYSSMKSDEDTTNSVYQLFGGQLEFFHSEYSEITSSVVPKILKFDDKKLREYINQDELVDYDYYFKSILNFKKHTLSEEEEKLISILSPVINEGGNTAYYLMNADLKFGKIKDHNNKYVELNDSNYQKFMKSSHRVTRKNAFEKYHSVYGSVNNTLATTYNEVVKSDVIFSKLRKYEDSLSSYLDDNKISKKVYTNLIETVHNNLDVCYKYFDVKRKLLNLDEFHLYDSYVDVVKDNNKKYSFDTAKKIVLDALKVYGDEYINVLNMAFEKRWIDKYPNIGKRSGAYSTGSYDTYPFVLLNYTDTYSDVSTIAHELGHSMHTYFSNNYNSSVKSSYPIFLAEIASTTNELLLSDYMYKNATNKEEKIFILNGRLDLFKATIYRQTMFAEFELLAHKEVEKGNILTADFLNEEYYKLNRLYFGDNVVVDDLIKYEWSRIPHFYSPFYVYQYATSLSISCYVAKNLIDGTPGFREKYIEFLKSGGRDYPLEVLKIIDIDLNDNKVYQEALNVFRDNLNEFIKLEGLDGE